jgi:protein phosphatase
LRSGDPATCADRLIQLALEAGGPDNITVVVADVLDDRG